jgi:flap endonuclease-1
MREQATREWQDALKTGDYATAFSKAVKSSHLTRPMIEDSKRLLQLLGIPFVQAPSEAEAQAAYMAQMGDVWAASSKDYDSLLFGAPRLQRYLTISGREFLPSKGISRPLKPELIELGRLLSAHGIRREQLIDLAIMIGTDFNEGIKGVGPKTALKLVKDYGSLDNMPEEMKETLENQNCHEIQRFFLEPETTAEYRLEYGELQEEELYRFLCDERDFSRDRVETVILRMRNYYANRRQTGLQKWLRKI